MALVAIVPMLRASAGQSAFAGYEAQWTKDINAEIDARVERFRKADFSADGFPAGTEVRIDQLTK